MLNLQSKLKVSEDSALSEDLRIARSKKTLSFCCLRASKGEGRNRYYVKIDFT